MPAIAFTSVVLPEPERPKSATIGASLRNAASSAKAPRRTATSTSSMARRLASARRTSHSESASAPSDSTTEKMRQAQRLRVAARHLRERVDGERQRLRLAGNVGDERDGRAELAQGAREREQRAGDDARTSRAAA